MNNVLILALVAGGAWFLTRPPPPPAPTPTPQGSGGGTSEAVDAIARGAGGLVTGIVKLFG